MNEVRTSPFGDLLRRMRLEAGLTQEGLAERAGISAKAVSELERDADRRPRLDTATRLAAALALDDRERARLLRAARPATAASPPVTEQLPAALPVPLTPLFGRAAAVDDVAALICGGEWPTGVQLVTLTGPGGVGKTRLALAVASRVAATFADGAVFVDLAPLRDPRLVLAAIARQLGLDERDPRALSERLADTVRGKHLLLVVDNIEHLPAAWEDVRALVAACPRLTVLATSRVPLRVRGEREYRVGPLDVPDGVSPGALAQSPAAVLFLDRARASGGVVTLTAESAPAVAAICRQLDGLPLAIELAAAWTRLLPLPALLDRLARRLPLLVAGPADLPQRQRTMRDAIAWSHELLTAPQQRLFRHLCVFANGWTVAAAAALAGEEDEPALLAELAGLVDRSLLHVRHDGGEPRFFILETLREYGLERLADSGEGEDARSAHAAYLLALAEEAERGSQGPDAARWSARLEQEHDNLRAALHWSLARPDDPAGPRLAVALWRFWFDRGYLGEGRQWLGAALAHRAGNAAIRTRTLLGAAWLAIEQGAFDDARSLAARAIDLARASGFQRDLVAALNVAGRATRDHGDYAAARRHHEHALALARDLGDAPGQAAALTGLACAATFTGDPARGSDLARQSLAILRTGKDRRALADALLGATVAFHHLGAFAETEALAAEALALFRDLGDTSHAAEALWTLAVTAQFWGQHDRAIALHEENLALRRARGDEHGTIQPISALALIALLEGDHQRARALLDETMVLLEHFDEPWARAMSLTLLGQVEIVAGDPARATALLADGARIFLAIGNPLYLPWCLEGLAAIAAGRGDWARAARLCGARDALRAGAGAGVPPALPASYARTVAGCRAALGDDAFHATHAAGSALTPRQALAEAGITVQGP